MSTDYYARLEQQRGPQPSPPMLASLARALRLSADERDYLYRVAGHSTPDHVSAHEHVAPGLLRVMDRLADTPALIVSQLGEVLVQNELAKALLGDSSAFSGMERSTAYRWFVHPESEQWRYPESDRQRQSHANVASLRVAYGSMGPQSPAGDLVRAISARSAEFAALWDRHEVARRFEDHKILIHPETGPIELDCQVLFTDDGAQTLLVLTAAPRSEAEGKLKLLAVVGQQEFSTSQ